MNIPVGKVLKYEYLCFGTSSSITVIGKHNIIFLFLHLETKEREIILLHSFVLTFRLTSSVLTDSVGGLRTTLHGLHLILS